MRALTRSPALMSFLGGVTITLSYACAPEDQANANAIEESSIPASAATRMATGVSVWTVADGAERARVRGLDAEGRDVFVAAVTFAPDEIRIKVELPVSMELVARGDEPNGNPADSLPVSESDGPETSAETAQTSMMLAALGEDTRRFELPIAGKANPQSSGGLRALKSALLNGMETPLLKEESFCSWASRTARLAATDCATKAKKNIKVGPSQTQEIRKCNLTSKEALQNFSCAKAGTEPLCAGGDGECMQIQATCTKVREPKMFMYSSESYIPNKPDGNVLQTVATPGYAVPVRRLAKKDIGGASYSQIKFTGGGQMSKSSVRWILTNCLEPRKLESINTFTTPYYKVEEPVDLYKAKGDTKPACQAKLAVGTELYKWDDGGPAGAYDPNQTSSPRVYVRLISNQGKCSVKEGWVPSYSLSISQNPGLF